MDIASLLVFAALAALPVLVVVVVLLRNARRAAAGFPAWSTYRVPDPNEVDWDDFSDD